MATSRWGITYDAMSQKYSGCEGANAFEKANLALASMGLPQDHVSEKPAPLPPRWYNPQGSRMSDEDWKCYQPGSLADSVNRMFSQEYNGSWSTFSSTKWYREYQSDVRTGYLSLEYIHNNVVSPSFHQ